MSESIIRLRNVTKLYGSAVGVKHVDLDVAAGTVLGFLGPNGAGKSTTINMLLDLIRPTSGSIELFGLDAQKQSLQIRRRIGFLAGDMIMDKDLTGWQQLQYFGNLRGGYDKQYVSELAERLSFNLNRKFKTLSRGNRQKVGLISALMHKPELLILDEPTSGLDPLIQAEFNKILLEHKKSGGTAFISSHVLSEVQEVCDDVTFIREGRIIATKPIAAIAKESPKEFSVETNDNELMTALKKLKGMEFVESSVSSAHGHYVGDVNDLIKLLAKHKVDSLTLQDAELESIFMKYYEGEDSNA